MIFENHPKAHSTITMADKYEEIVRCEYCYKYLPVSVHNHHIKDDCLVKLAYQYGFNKPSQWHRLTQR